MNAHAMRIVVGVDGSDEAAHALRWSAWFAKITDAEVIAVYALTPIGEFTLSLPPFPPRNLRHEFQDELDNRWCAPLRDLGVRYRGVVVESRPVPALIRISEREHATFLVVGGHRHGTLTDHVIGTVAARLVHRGKTPVLVVPVGTATDEADAALMTGALGHRARASRTWTTEGELTSSTHS